MDKYKRGLDKLKEKKKKIKNKGGRGCSGGMLVMMNMTEGGDSSPTQRSRSQAGT